MKRNGGKYKGMTKDGDVKKKMRKGKQRYRPRGKEREKCEMKFYIELTSSTFAMRNNHAQHVRTRYCLITPFTDISL